MRESAPDSIPIEISDVSHTVFLKILEYLYTDTVSNVSLDLGIHLMVASELFMLDRLKGICEDVIRGEINVGNVISILVASHQHNALGLKELALEFMLRNLTDTKIQDGLEDLKAEPDLLVEILRLSPFQPVVSPPRQNQTNRGHQHQADRSLQRQQGQLGFPGMHPHNQQHQQEQYGPDGGWNPQR
jgi:hypothetical protein